MMFQQKGEKYKRAYLSLYKDLLEHVYDPH